MGVPHEGPERRTGTPLRHSSDAVWAAFSRHLVRGLRCVLRRQWVLTVEFVVPTPTDGPVDVAQPLGINIRRGTLDDAPALEPLVVGEPPKRRFVRGDVALVAEHDGRLIGCAWLASRPLPLYWIRIKVLPRPDRWYAYGDYVLPQFRRRGVHTALQAARLLEAQRVGARTMFGHVNLLNPGALVANRQFGWTPREESLGMVVLDRFAITLWGRQLDPLRRPLMRTAPKQAVELLRRCWGAPKN
jgi:GNAT superfamily N-acetyltransferase